MNDFLTKPVSVQKLAASLRRLFGSGTAMPDDSPLPSKPAPSWAGSHPVVDESAVAMALQAMSREKLAAMVETFLDQAPETVQRLRAAVRDAQPLDLRTNAHAAKGAALNLGMAALAATAEALHEGAAHLPAHEIARLVQRYEDLVPATRLAMCELGVLRTVAQPVVTE
jgi:HPt (histidine-containing phosphotransfer) domain-containing protein